MSGLQLSQDAQLWVNMVLIWVGFGALAGLLARAILPIRHPNGLMPTLTLGIVGSAGGLLVLSMLYRGQELNPISPLGFLAATAGAFLLIVIYRALHGYLARGGEDLGA
ncbi:MAG: GlsB/YeaQ/YmgE family stress response membrane protein [Candidatus Nealsonbacteria bacterium]|nr:GlsB/YeaQ/YmgE family stress response membrane protein [Candidatus Nealsonbacteria bacterium]